MVLHGWGWHPRSRDQHGQKKIMRIAAIHDSVSRKGAKKGMALTFPASLREDDERLTLPSGCDNSTIL